MKHTLETNGRGGVRVVWEDPPALGQVFTDQIGDEVVFDGIDPAGMLLCTRKSDSIQQAHMPHELTPANTEQSHLANRAFYFAKAAHEAVGQVRKYTGEPYIIHPAEVAVLVETVPHTEDMLAAALLHDTVEDTEVSLGDIEREFGTPIANLVGWLTDVSRPEDGNRAERKAIDRNHTAQAPAAAKTIKLADLISNSQSIIEHDLEFARTYLSEKAALLEVLKEGDPELWERANKLLQEGLLKVAGTKA